MGRRRHRHQLAADAAADCLWQQQPISMAYCLGYRSYPPPSPPPFRLKLLPQLRSYRQQGAHAHLAAHTVAIAAAAAADATDDDAPTYI